MKKAVWDQEAMVNMATVPVGPYQFEPEDSGLDNSDEEDQEQHFKRGQQDVAECAECVFVLVQHKFVS